MDKDTDICIVCSICLDVIDDMSGKQLTSCGHIFHTHCLRQWESFKNSKFATCPYCRSINVGSKYLNKIEITKEKGPDKKSDDTRLIVTYHHDQHVSVSVYIKDETHLNQTVARLVSYFSS